MGPAVLCSPAVVVLLELQVCLQRSAWPGLTTGSSYTAPPSVPVLTEQLLAFCLKNGAIGKNRSKEGNSGNFPTIYRMTRDKKKAQFVIPLTPLLPKQRV